MLPVWIGLGLLAAVIAWIYNGLVRQKNLAQEGWSGIDVQLKRRADLIPNLVDTVKGYAAHESGVFDKVTQARAETFKAASPDDRGRTEAALSGALGNLMAVAENYPDLKANQNFLALQKALADTEDQIQMARRYYNGTVRNLNIAIQSFPNNLIASLFHFQPMAFFDLDNPADKAVPQVSLSQ
jgi:LemA protein